MGTKTVVSPAEASPAGNRSGARSMHVAIYCLVLAAVTLAFYNPIVRNQFIAFDDSSYIVKNAQVQHGLNWDTIKWAFTTFREGNWHPLTWLSHALDYQLFHLNPAGHHYTNLLLHALNAVLLFLLLRRATGLTWPSFLVGALLALHPINVESVAWVAERKNVLSMLFFLLALYAYDRYAHTGRRDLYVSVAVLFALGLLAKPQIVTLPFVLLLWDYWPLQRFGVAPSSAAQRAPAPRSLGGLVWEKWPLFALAAADSVVTVVAQRAGNTVRTFEEVSLAARLENVFVAYVRYIGKAFWPSELVPMYPRSLHAMPLWEVAGSAILLALFTLAVWRWRSRRYLAFGWFWFLGTLVPMIGIITVGEQTMADRYAYIPLIGIFVAVAWTLDAMVRERRLTGAWCVGASVAVVMILGGLTWRQLGYWRDDDTLWRYTLRVTEGNYMAHNNLALSLAKQGRNDEAVAEFHEARLEHKYPPDQVLMLVLYELRVGHPQEALQECDSVLRTNTIPKYQALTWAECGQVHLMLRQYDAAAEDYQNALRIGPQNEMALVGVGVLALRQGNIDEAVTMLRSAVKVYPSPVNLLLLAQAQRRSGNDAEADATLAQAQKSSADLGDAESAAGQLLSVAGVPPI